MAVVGMVRESIAATPNHHFDISGGFDGSDVGEMGTLESSMSNFFLLPRAINIYR
jgi:hypothetical protein